MTVTDRYQMHAAAFHFTTVTARALEVRSMVVSADMDRVPFGTVTIVCAPVDDTTWQWLDPRNSGTTGARVLWGVDRWDAETDEYIHGLPWRDVPHSATFPAATACIRTRKRNILTGEITITATTYEVLLDDKRRIAGTIATIAAAVNLWDMTLAALNDAAIGTDLSPGLSDTTGASAVLIPAGDRRTWLQGQTWSDFFESEMGSTGRRLYDALRGNDFHIRNDTDAPFGLFQPTTLALRDGPDGHVISFDETTDREEWADGVLVKFSYVNGAGATVTTYQASPAGGTNTKGQVVTRDRPAPSTNLADRIRTRTLIRGKTYELEGTAELDAYPAQTMTVTVAGVAYVSQIRSVEWRFPEGTMSIRSQVQ